MPAKNPTKVKAHSPPTCLDLFAGCGGLSLGFEQAGFTSIASLEKSPMAAETYYRNFRARGAEWDDQLWRHIVDLGERKKFREQADHGTVIGSVWDVLDDEDAMDYFVGKSPDVIMGGPPCQGFSMAGRRNPADERNQLPSAFLRFVRILRPKAVVIENVLGINRAFKSRGGVVPAFEQLQQALAEEGDGYVVQPVEVNARHFGVAQNRPRMMLLALRKDLPAAKGLITEPIPWRSVNEWEAKTGSASHKPSELSMIPKIGSRINGDPALTEHTAWEAICDLSPKGYRHKADAQIYSRPNMRYAAHMRGIGTQTPEPFPLNQSTRNHSERATQRFDLYHYFSEQGISSKVLAIPLTSGSERAARAAVKKHLGIASTDLPADRIFVSGGDRSLVDVVMRLGTKKHTQRVVERNVPAPTVVTLPDDYVHPMDPRIMTVRELARIQSFPDWFEFRSKETTGSTRRKFEVPQYSQVGNAVPPLMAQAIGELIAQKIRK